MPVINDGKDRRVGESALITIFGLIKEKFVKKEYRTGSTSNYKTLSDNDLTDALKEKYDAAYTHSQSAHAPENAEANILESVKVNGAAQAITGKAVDISVPVISTNIDSDSADDTKAASPKAVATYVASAVSGLSKFSKKVLATGQYNTATGLPTVTGEDNVIYLVPLSASANNNAFNEFMYINGSFELVGSTQVDFSNYIKKEDLIEFTPAEVQSIWSTVESSS